MQLRQEIYNSEILHKAMWNSYNEVKQSNYIMDGLEDHQKLAILKDFLLPYFIKIEEYAICTELQVQIKTLNV